MLPFCFLMLGVCHQKESNNQSFISSQLVSVYQLKELGGKMVLPVAEAAELSKILLRMGC